MAFFLAPSSSIKTLAHRLFNSYVQFNTGLLFQFIAESMDEGQLSPSPAQKRFILVTTLLSMIDQVRGEPTTHGLDRHPHDSIQKRENQLKKFLDSFAWICSTSRIGGDTASAVCLEQDHPLGTVLRVARNLGAPDDLVEKLQNILDDLSVVASGESKASEKEPVILAQIINLCSDKISGLLEKLAIPKVHEQVVDAIESLDADDSPLDDAEHASFLMWVRNLVPLTIPSPTSSVEALSAHIKWASKARWRYSEQLEELFPQGDDFPLRFSDIYRLGRYYVATKCMLQVVVKQPQIFESIYVQAVEAPPQQRFSIMNDRTALMQVLKKLTDVDHQGLMAQLGQLWFTEKPEQVFRRRCHMDLTVHAEMQLLTFYDHHPSLIPRLLFMGTSKKACYLCHKFMSRHPLGMGVSACHQKLYPSWMPAPCTNSAVKKAHKVLLWELSRHLEQTTARDLETRLGIPKRPRNLDSTAGPSMPTAESRESNVFQDGVSLPISRSSSVVGEVGDLLGSISLQDKPLSRQPFFSHKRLV